MSNTHIKQVHTHSLHKALCKTPRPSLIRLFFLPGTETCWLSRTESSGSVMHKASQAASWLTETFPCTLYAFLSCLGWEIVCFSRYICPPPPSLQTEKSPQHKASHLTAVIKDLRSLPRCCIQKISLKSCHESIKRFVFSSQRIWVDIKSPQIFDMYLINLDFFFLPITAFILIFKNQWSRSCEDPGFSWMLQWTQRWSVSVWRRLLYNVQTNRTNGN